MQLPFLQRVCPEVPVLSVAVGASSSSAGAALLDAIVTEEAFLVVSTDLSHYHDAGRARRLDARSAAAITVLDYATIGPDDACGCHPLRAMLAWAERAGLRVRLLDLRSSADTADTADTAGDPGQVVGYGAFAIRGPVAT